MLLINNNILLSNNESKFEAHVFEIKELPFIFHEGITGTSGGDVIFNVHENIEFLFIARGEAWIRYDREIMHFESDEIAVINSFAPHQIIRGKELDCYCLIIDSSFLNDNGINPNELCFTRRIADAEACRLFKCIVDAYHDNSELRIAAIKSSILAFLLLVCRRYTQKQKPKNEKELEAYRRFQMAINYIKNHISEKMSIDEIADYLHISKYYFLRQFKAVSGDTVVNYIHYLRCERAKLLLRSGNYTVKEVGELCGFENASYFASVFKKFTEYTPGEFKNSHLRHEK